MRIRVLQIIQACTIVTSVWIVTAVAGGTANQIGQTTTAIVFENKDFAVVPVASLRNPQLADRSLSGLLVFRGHSGVIGSSAEIWKFSGPQSTSDSFYWADSARGDRLNQLSGDSRGFLVVPKSGARLNRKVFSADWPDAFKQSVGDDIQSIAGLVVEDEYVKRPSQTEEDRARAGFEDLSLKSHWVASTEENPLIEVTARTIGSSGAIVQRCSVWYVPVAWADDKSHWRRFDQFSSPTSQSIPVGQYNMWANYNGKNGRKSIVSPGDDLKPKKTIDLDAP